MDGDLAAGVVAVINGLRWAAGRAAMRNDDR